MILDKLGNTSSSKVQTNITSVTGYSDLFHVGAYPLCAPISIWYNGATYTCAMGLDADNNPPKVFKYKDGVLEYAFVGTIDNNDPLTHNHCVIDVDGSGYLYIYVVNGHGEEIKIYKSDVSESIVDGWTLHHTISGVQVGYINLTKKDGVVKLLCRNTGDAPNYSLRLFYSDANDFTTWTSLNLTNAQSVSSNQYFGRHYPFNIEHYGTNKWHYFATCARYDRPTQPRYYAHAILKTQDFTTFYNLAETSSYDAVSNNLGHSPLFSDYLIVGSLDEPLNTINGANYIVINDVIYGSYFDRENNQFKFIRIIDGVKTEYPCNFNLDKAFGNGNINAIKIIYNGTNFVMLLQDSWISSYYIGVCDLNFDNQRVVLDLFDTKTGIEMVTAEIPVNLNEITGDWMLAGGDGFEEDATEGLFMYQILDTVFDLDITETAPNAITNLSATNNVLNWTSPTANTYPVAYYEIYVDGVLTATTPTNSYQATVDDIEHSYYVKSVNLNGTKSDRSNIITETLTPNIPVANIISYWNFDSDANDQVGSNNMTTNLISYVSGLVGNCADFTASTSSNTNIPDDDTMSFGDGSTDVPFSISFWIKFSSVSGTIQILEKKSSSNTVREYQVTYFSGDMYFRLWDESAVAYIGKVYNISFSTGTWYHLCMTYDGSSTSDGVKMYINNSVVGTNNSSGTYIAMENGGQSVSVGKSKANTTQSLDGYLDEFAFFDKELIASEVDVIYNQGLGGSALTA